MTALIGPNAAGKSTLLKCMAGILQPEGTIRLDGRDFNTFKREEITRLISYLPQDPFSRGVLTVFESVLLGRLNSLSWRVGDRDLEITLHALEDSGIEDLASRPLDELSGGQKQSVAIACSLVRDPALLLMDELTNNLDLRHQLEAFELLRDITVERQMSTVVALHDINLAARYADNLIILCRGTVYAKGAPSDVLTPEIIHSVYGVNARVEVDSDGVPHVTPLNSVRRLPRGQRASLHTR